MNDFLGKGTSFPFTMKDNKIYMTQDEALVKESIGIILSTEPGERLMHPDFGAGLSRLAFSQNNTVTATLIADRVEESLKKWEPRIKVLLVDVSPDPEEKNRLNILIDYLIRKSNSKKNMVYPFYLHGAE